jgi:hypothetical protein
VTYLGEADDRALGLPTLPTVNLSDRDVELALWIMYELHYGSFDGIGDAAERDVEWDVELLALRARLEAGTEQLLRRAWVESGRPRALEELMESYADAPSVAAFLKSDATFDEAVEILRQKSIYHLKESDPQCFVIPRLDPPAKAALMELQFDEFGGGDPDRVHSKLYGDALLAAGLDPRHGAYIDEAMASTLAISNAMSMLCLRRRLRFAAMGHLAAFEGTSSLPCREIVLGLQRLDFPEPVIRYFDEHIEADAVHEQLAVGLCRRLAGDDADIMDEILFGACICLELESRWADEFLSLEAAA